MNICVYAGSSQGARSEYRDAAKAFGELLAAEGIGLVYGGASVGLMGVLANSALTNGGTVIGVITEALKHVEIAHAGLTELRVVETMHERKAVMAELSDAFVALAGGIGTFEELFEVWTWSQLGIHAKPCGLLNTAGFYDQLAGFLDHVVAEQFLKPVHRGVVCIEDDPRKLLETVRRMRVTDAPKWFGMDKV